MAVSGKDLDRQVAELFSLCPTLQPGIVPQGYHDADLQVYAAAEGASAYTAFCQLCEAEGQGVKACSVCGVGGEVVADDGGSEAMDGGSDNGGDGSAELRFTTFTRLSFLQKTLELTHAGFACGRCRAMRDVRRFVHFAAMRLGPTHFEREALAHELCAHFVATNHVSDAILSNSNAYVVWVQEVYSRAYALQVVASNIQGWKMVGPLGEPIQRGAPGTTLALAQQLLKRKARKPSKKAKASSNGLLAPLPSAANVVDQDPASKVKGKRKKRRQPVDETPADEAANGSVGAQPAGPSSKRRSQKQQADQTAVVDATDGSVDEPPGSLSTGKRKKKNKVQQQVEAAAAGIASGDAPIRRQQQQQQGDVPSTSHHPVSQAGPTPVRRDSAATTVKTPGAKGLLLPGLGVASAAKRGLKLAGHGKHAATAVKGRPAQGARRKSLG